MRGSFSVTVRTATHNSSQHTRERAIWFPPVAGSAWVATCSTPAGGNHPCPHSRTQSRSSRSGRCSCRPRQMADTAAGETYSLDRVTEAVETFEWLFTLPTWLRAYPEHWTSVATYWRGRASLAYRAGNRSATWDWQKRAAAAAAHAEVVRAALPENTSLGCPRRDPIGVWWVWYGMQKAEPHGGF